MGKIKENVLIPLELIDLQRSVSPIVHFIVKVYIY